MMDGVNTRLAPYFLTAPGVVFFAALLGAPMLMTFLLSLHSYDFTTGIQTDWTLANYIEVLVSIISSTQNGPW